MEWNPRKSLTALSVGIRSPDKTNVAVIARTTSAGGTLATRRRSIALTTSANASSVGTFAGSFPSTASGIAPGPPRSNWLAGRFQSRTTSYRNSLRPRRGIAWLTSRPVSSAPSASGRSRMMTLWTGTRNRWCKSAWYSHTRRGRSASRPAWKFRSTIHCTGSPNPTAKSVAALTVDRSTFNRCAGAGPCRRRSAAKSAQWRRTRSFSVASYWSGIGGSPRHLSPILENLSRRIAPARADYAAGGVRRGTAEVQPLDRRAIVRPSGGRAETKEPVQVHRPLEDVAAGQAERPLQVRRRQHLPVDDRAAEVRCVLVHHLETAVGEGVAAVV